MAGESEEVPSAGAAVGNSIKRRREELRLNQQTAAERSHMGVSKFKEIENNKRTRQPFPKDLANISRALNFKTKDFLSKVAAGIEPEYQPPAPEEIVTLDSVRDLVVGVLRTLNDIAKRTATLEGHMESIVSRMGNIDAVLAELADLADVRHSGDTVYEMDPDAPGDGSEEELHTLQTEE